jgi:Histone methylation protein DOT1.
MFWNSIKLLAQAVFWQFRRFLEWLAEAITYYPFAPRFAGLDLTLILLSFWKSPFRLCRIFWEKKGSEGVQPYGETPLFSFAEIARIAQIGKNDHFIDLGSGRGRLVFWAREFLGCQATGIEAVAEFVEWSQDTKEFWSEEGVDFIRGDFSEIDLSFGSVLYLFGPTLSDEFYQKLVKRFDSLKMGTQVITVSTSLDEYPGGESFELMHRFQARFDWGEADVFIQTKR